MVFKRSKVFSYFSVASVIGSILAGCAGSSSSVQGLSPVVTTTGGVSSAGGTSTNPVGSSTSPQQVQVTSGGGVVTGTLPPGESIPAGGSVAVVSNSSPIIIGLGLGPKSTGNKAAPATTGTQGEVYVDGQYSGVNVTSGGALSSDLILTVGTHTLTAYGPFVIVGGSAFAPQTLTVGEFNFSVIVLPDGTASIPSAITLQLPANNGTLGNGNFVTAGYPAEFAGYNGKLTIDYAGTSVFKGVSLTVSSTTGLASASYSALSAHPQVPSTGVTSVTFNITAP